MPADARRPIRIACTSPVVGNPAAPRVHPRSSMAPSPRASERTTFESQLKGWLTMSYVDGYVLPIPKKQMSRYRRMAVMGRKAWMKHGALDYKECAGDDLAAKWGTPFTRAMKLKPGETVIFAYIVFKSRAHRDRVNAKVMSEMQAAMGAS